MLSLPVERRHFVLLNEEDRRLLADLPHEFEDLEEIRGLWYRNLDLGYAALSTVITALRDPEPDLHEHAAFIRRAMETALISYLSMQKQLRQINPDRVYFFNGRFALMRGALRACEKAGVEYFTYEIGGQQDRFGLYRNTLPHDIDNLRRQIVATWEKTPVEKRDSLAWAFYESRARGKLAGSHTAAQREGALPPGWSADRYNVVIFGSSEDEYAAIGDTYRNPLYRHQRDGIRRIVADLCQEPAFDLYLRMHPNLRGLENRSIDELLQLPQDRVTVIPPESDISSYAMLESADLVITFGSTMGIEAAYRGRPSVLAGRAFYERLGSVYEPDSHEALIALAKSRPPPLSIKGAKKAGLYKYTLGEPYRYFESNTIGRRFKGKRIRLSHSRRMWSSLIKRAPRMTVWLAERILARRVQRLS